MLILNHENAICCTSGDGEVTARRGVPALSHGEAYGSVEEAFSKRQCKCNQSAQMRIYSVKSSPRLGDDFPQNPYSIIVTHVLEVDIIHLRKKALSYSINLENIRSF